MKILILFAVACLTLASCNQNRKVTERQTSGQCDKSDNDCCGQSCGCRPCGK